MVYLFIYKEKKPKNQRLKSNLKQNKDHDHEPHSPSPSPPPPCPQERQHDSSSPQGSSPCLLLDSHRASSLQKAAALLGQGQVVGVPTDTVYALAASCRHPDSISRLFHVKGRPPEKPICLCLASLDQLEAARPPFSPLLWDFMRRCYPGGRFGFDNGYKTEILMSDGAC